VENICSLTTYMYVAFRRGCD